VSRETVEIAKRLIDAFNRRDIDQLAELATVDFEWCPAMPGTAAGVSFRGREGLEGYLAEIGETWQEYRSVADELRDLGDRVLVLGRLEGRGVGSGARRRGRSSSSSARRSRGCAHIWIMTRRYERPASSSSGPRAGRRHGPGPAVSRRRRGVSACAGDHRCCG
jgi:ketosteroid isomerase-like protein